ncbi:hypothetical protein LAZ67_2000496 [Cordylochernes scorpioides]|uniref:Peroxidase n=1 Tax=Cordylochernes scorpioides TaxID=51811 RepID=A0ABY6K0P9_9ARAC|nr:hypothetical protein LAZ67_2000496 [Cordylochernes scorpioides]
METERWALHTAEYDLDLEPGTVNALATAVFPAVLASLMPTPDPESIPDLLTRKSRHPSPALGPDLTRGFHRNLTTGEGLDFAALTIQQGRDHGLPSYVEYRTFCNLEPSVADWSDLQAIAGPEAADRLSSLYRDVRDVDLFTGLLAELPSTPGSLFGPTLSCLLGQQFLRLRRADRFCSVEQLAAIRSVTFARILCDNVPGLHRVQPSAVLVSDPYL